MIPMKKKVSTIQENDSGRNTSFLDNQTGKKMSRKQFVRAIQDGKYIGYHVRSINGVATPCSNPDKSKENNLG